MGSGGVIGVLLCFGVVQLEVGIGSQFGDALGEVSFGQGLHSPEHAFGEPGAVTRDQNRVFC